MFLPGFLVAIDSFYKHNPWFKEKWVVLYEDQKFTNFDALAQYNIEFVQIPIDVYKTARITHKHPGKLQIAAYCLHGFTLSYDQIIFLDADILVLDDISELWDFQKPINATWRKRGGWQAGVFAADKTQLPDNILDKLIHILKNEDNKYAEQDALNKFIKRDKIRANRLPASFNMFAHRWKPDKIPNPKILHYAGGNKRKPWLSKRNGKAHLMWHKYNEELQNRNRQDG